MQLVQRNGYLFQFNKIDDSWFKGASNKSVIFVGSVLRNSVIMCCSWKSTYRIFGFVSGFHRWVECSKCLLNQNHVRDDKNKAWESVISKKQNLLLGQNQKKHKKFGENIYGLKLSEDFQYVIRQIRVICNSSQCVCWSLHLNNDLLQWRSQLRNLGGWPKHLGGQNVWF